MAQVVVVMNRPAVTAFKGWNGPVGISVSRLTRMIANTQRANAPVRTGKLLASIKVGSRSHWAAGIAVNVGANPPVNGPGSKRGYSYMQNEGTKPHMIFPRGPYPLRFFWAGPRGPNMVVTRWAVRHPGTRALHWADRGLAVAMRAWSR